MGSVYEIWNSPRTHQIRLAEYEGARDVRVSKNRREAANVSLQEFSRSLANVKKAEAAGKEYTEAVSQMAAGLEGRSASRLNANLAASERLGALAAQAAAAGVGGTTVELLSDTVKLQRNIEQDLSRISTERMAAGGARASAQIMDNAFSQFDLSTVRGNFDYTINVVPKPLKKRALKLLGVAAATYFGGPQAGQAAADAAMGEWKANNGDWNAAANYFGRAASGLAASVDDWGGGSSNSNSWFGAVMQRTKASAEKDNQKMQFGNISEGKYTFGDGFGSSWEVNSRGNSTGKTTKATSGSKSWGK